MDKVRVEDLAMFGGRPLFPRPVSTSNLVKPNFESFIDLLLLGLSEQGELELVETLEKELCDFHNVRNCVSLCNGFWALVLTIRQLALSGRSEVIIPSLTYRRLADVVSWAGLIPRFCEVDEASLAVSPSSVMSQIGPNTALIIGVHPIVNCCDAPSIEAIAMERGIPIMFDSVESVYETIAGRRVGSFGAAECFSFHASKLINGFEGGYVTTNDDALARRLRKSRVPAQQHISSAQGMEARMPAAHVAMALQGLRELPSQIQHNREIYRCYQEGLATIEGVELIEFDESEQTSYKNILVRLTDHWPLTRSLTLNLLNREGILSRAYYFPALHQKAYEYPVVKNILPVSDRASQQYVLMPCGYQVAEADVDLLIDFLAFVKRNSVSINSRTSTHHES